MEIDRRVAEVEEAVGRRLIVRAVRTDERQFRGYVEVRPRCVVIEYAEELPGYFWGYELLERLLCWVETGGGCAYFYEQSGRLIRVPCDPEEREG